MVLGDQKPDRGAEAVRKLRTGDVQSRLEAVRALAEMGPLGVPGLLEALRDKDRTVSREAAWKLGVTDKSAIPELIKALQDKSAYVRGHAAHALGGLKLRFVAAPAVPALIELLKNENDEDVYHYVHISLSWIGKAAQGPLIEALKNPNPRVRYRVASTLASIANEIEEEALPAVPHLLRLLHDPDPEVRRLAPSRLMGFGPHAKEGIAALFKALKKALQDKDQEMVRNVLNTFGAIGPAAKGVVPTLIEMADKDKSPQNRFLVLTALEGIGPEGKGALPVIAKIIDEDFNNAWVMEQAAKTLGGIGPAGKPGVVSILTKLLKHSWSTVRIASAASFLIIEPGNKNALNELFNGLQDEDYLVRRDAALVLGKTGPAAKAAIPALKRLLQDEIVEVRQAAEQSLKAIQANP